MKAEKAQNEKFIFSHVEVMYFYAVSFSARERKPKINPGCFMNVCYVMAWRVLIFLLEKYEHI